MTNKEEGTLTAADLAEAARARASFTAFLNMHFNRLPDTAFVEQVRGVEFTGALDSLAASSDVEPEVAAGAKLMLDHIRANAAVELGKASDDLGVDRTRLYRGVSPSYGPPPPYEAVWRKDMRSVPEFLQDLARTYREAGVSLASDAGERLDYIGVQLDFVRLLAEREAAAWEGSDEAEAARTLQGEVAFFRSHLANWASYFIDTALKRADTDFYRGHLQMVRGFINSEMERLDCSPQASGAVT
jgi:TorA maturation chaperone TorD